MRENEERELKGESVYEDSTREGSVVTNRSLDRRSNMSILSDRELRSIKWMAAEREKDGRKNNIVIRGMNIEENFARKEYKRKN